MRAVFTPCMTSLPVLMTTREVADQLRIHPATVRRWVADGRLTAVEMPGRAKRYRRDDIEALLQSDDQKPAAS